MTREQLQKTLAELRAELTTLEADNETTKNHIEQLVGSLEQHLTETPNEANRAALRENVTNTIERFEAEHPRSTLILNQIMNTLSGSGI